ncbi:hypothetical protein B296_00000714 [Ensete ventricosum]|uniref:Uncharacterized protein n=1 Tax=Ensete ventricosum TaxID=4639 RepID=A0A427B8X2_ENSVE|nr:hypothetical protein B296_00000714 [Ensete ventricosum]
MKDQNQKASELIEEDRAKTINLQVEELMVDELRDRIGTRTSSVEGERWRTNRRKSIVYQPGGGNMRDGTVDLIRLGGDSGRSYSPIAGTGRHILLVVGGDDPVPSPSYAPPRPAPSPIPISVSHANLLQYRRRETVSRPLLVLTRSTRPAKQSCIAIARKQQVMASRR